MSKKRPRAPFTVEQDHYVSVDVEISTEDVCRFITEYANADDIAQIDSALEKKVSYEEDEEIIRDANAIILDVLRELMLCGESAAIEMLRREMVKQGVSVYVAGGAV
mgnify:CR=1 FL=1